MVISVLVAVILSVVLWDQADRRLLAGWLACIFTVAGLRLALMYAHSRDRRHQQRVALWDRLFVATLTLTGVVWGLGGWWLMPSESLVHQAVVYFFLMGMASGAVASYSAHLVATSIVLSTLMLPATLWLALQDGLIPRAMALGGVIYLAAAYRATRTLSYFVRRSFQLAEELRAARDEAQQLARVDALTGLLNRRGFYEFAQRLVRQAQRAQRPIAALMLDLDHFKRVNDTHGHAIGDETLRMIATVIEETVRGSDIAGRLGGEEFGILLPDASIADAVASAERLRRRASEMVVRPGDVDLRITCSVGAAARGESESLDALLERADAALYAAKQGGRNRVETAA